jgi:hypothetical protein
MKYLYIIFLFLVFSENITAQGKLVEKQGNHFLFTYKNSTYLIENDSIFNISVFQEGFPKLHGLVMNEYKFIETPKMGYMKNASSGIVYSFDGVDFNRLDHSFDFKSQFRSYTFFHDGQIMDFGGYGLHSFKNIITYFNLAKKETELYNQETPIESSPIARDRMVAQYLNNNLYIGQGHGVLPNIKQPYQNADLISDYWKFSFENNTWTKLGERTIDIAYPYDVVYGFNNNSLLISDKAVFECDIKNNLLIQYKDANFGIIKSLNKINTLSSIAYNSYKNGFYVIIDKTYEKAEVLFVKRDHFLGTKKDTSKLYSDLSFFSWKLFSFSIFIIAVLFLFFISKKKNIVHRIKSKEKEIEVALKQEDFILLFKLVEAYPKYIDYSSLLDLYPEHLGYESKKKKIRQSIILIEEYLIRTQKLKGPIFVFRKNIEDKREKQIRIR